MYVSQTMQQVKEEILNGEWVGKLIHMRDTTKSINVTLEPIQSIHGFLEFYEGQGYGFYKWSQSAISV
ncbi:MULTISPECIES: hypothetical protein [unclassified Paenibacillus]|uniref:hypothetical protein n=1 Tax=unclassified Paenibacillus TaxID=185978 RepID=UPI00104CA9F4|nr:MULTISPECIES: hypothetical protein [unclassified Paenibacillus]NIK66992.1 hypothetical protein [Paenibacillus sp. BK720]TCN01045.1 hypothetical protein EV294_101497 [Paenibacillus sp. BK033]